ncbi:MAG: hypothetical protein P1U56_21430 [Saprospiraceae bacterium]|nr:hypothetical protein [Saprospiraceae bacterium]
MSNIFKSFDKEVSWNTKFYVLLALAMVVFSYVMNGTETAIFVGAIMSLLIVLLLDFYLILSKKYSKSWRIIKIILVLIIVAMTLIGFIPKLGT